MKRIFAVLLASVVTSSVAIANGDDDVIIIKDPSKEGIMLFPGIRGHNSGPISNENQGSVGAAMAIAEDYHDVGITGGVVFRVNQESPVRFFGNARVDVTGEHEDNDSMGQGAEHELGLAYANAGIGYKPAESSMFLNGAFSYDEDMFRTMDDVNSWGLHAEGGHENVYGRFSYKTADEVDNPFIDSVNSTLIGVTATYGFDVADATSFRVSGHLDMPLETEVKTAFGTTEEGDDSVVKRVSFAVSHKVSERFEIGAGVENTFSEDYDDEFSANASARLNFNL